MLLQKIHNFFYDFPPTTLPGTHAFELLIGKYHQNLLSIYFNKVVFLGEISTHTQMAIRNSTDYEPHDE
jgi:hypothetical protein